MRKNKNKLIDVARVKELFNYTNKELIWKVNKGLAKIGDKAYKNSRGYKVVKFDGISYLEHRILWALHKETQPSCIDHIDGNTSNNNIENLREATLSENNRNTKIYKSNKSGVKGIHWDNEKKKWFVQLWYDGKQNFLGRYKSLEEAKEIIENARLEKHQSFANNGY